MRLHENQQLFADAIEAAASGTGRRTRHQEYLYRERLLDLSFAVAYGYRRQG